MPVLKGTERRKARHSGSEKGNVLSRDREKTFPRQAIRHAQIKVEVCIELVFVVVSRQHCGVVDTAPRGLRTRDYKCAIGVLRVQQLERYRVNIRAVLGHGQTSECPGFAPEYSSKRGWCADLRYRRKAQRSNTAAQGCRIHIPCGLIGNKEEGALLRPRHWSPQSAPW